MYTHMNGDTCNYDTISAAHFRSDDVDTGDYATWKDNNIVIICVILEFI